MSRIVHYGYPAACGAWSEDSTGSGREQVTCKRCLASLARRDREFRAKARRGMTHANYIGVARYFAIHRAEIMKANAARAIAREEGRL